MKKSLLEIVNTVLEHAGLSTVEKLEDEAHVQKDLGLSSFNLAELSVRLEREFGKDVYADGVVLTIGEIKSRLND